MTATGAKAATKKVNRVEKCMLGAIDCDCDSVGVVEVAFCEDVCFWQMRICMVDGYRQVR